ncbi:acyltransferase [Citricoccus sp. SGAir0253]|uniref:acyltransferase family protein n=1 Tax=Citricoccus sp. SGAir0253 TaxID=2567881 RepID=UPI00143D6B26|nr:acyltransferase [Citricoccus sp. SGAir0253]
MDLFRGVAITLVITLHAVTMPAVRDVEPMPWLADLFLFLSPLRVPVLFAMSGMLLARAVRKPLGVYVSGKVRHLLWPFLLWGIITVLLVGRRSQFSDPWEWIGGFGHLWFLGTLLFCVALGWFTKWVPAWVPALALPVLLVLLEPSEPVLRDYLFYGTYYFLGAVLMTMRRTVQAAGPWVPIAGTAVGLLGMVATGDSPMTQFGVTGVLAPLPWFVVITWVGPRLPRMRFLEWIGRNSVIWYCAHFPALSLAVRWATQSGMDGVGVNLAALAGGVLFPLVLVLGGDWTRWLFSLPASRRARPVDSAPPVRAAATQEHARSGPGSRMPESVGSRSH